MKVDRKELQETLDKAAPGLADKEIIEQSTSYIFVDGFLVTFNDEIAISLPSPFGKEVEGAVPAKEFRNILAKLRDKEVDVYSTENELRIDGKNKKVGLAITKNVELPMADIINFDPNEVTWIELAQDTMEAIEFCLFSVSKNVNKPILNCLHLTGDMVESCDNYRITRFFMDKPTFLTPILIQADNIKNLPKYPDLKEYTVYDGWAHFRGDDEFVVSCRILEDSFPNVSKFITEGKTSVSFPDSLDAALQTAEVLVDHTKVDNEKVKIHLKESSLVLECQGPVGWFKEKVKYSDDIKRKKPVDFEIHPGFLRQILKLMNSAKVNNKAGVINFSGEKFVHVMSLLG